MSRPIRANMMSPKRRGETLIPETDSNPAVIIVRIIRPNSATKASLALRPSPIQKCALRILFSYSCPGPIPVTMNIALNL